jgi:hypothetical protein
MAIGTTDAQLKAAGEEAMKIFLCGGNPTVDVLWDGSWFEATVLKAVPTGLKVSREYVQHFHIHSPL